MERLFLKESNKFGWLMKLEHHYTIASWCLSCRGELIALTVTKLCQLYQIEY